MRVFLVTDHALLRDGLQLILETQPDIRVVGSAADVGTALRRISAKRPNVVVLDATAEGLDEIEATTRIMSRAPRVNVIVLSTQTKRDDTIGALEAGATGFLLKGSSGEELIEALRRVGRGDTPGFTSPFEQLSAREMEVLRHLIDGRSPKQIAATLGISPKTVDTYRARLMTKLEVESFAALVKLAIRHGVTAADA